ncbi:MAG TPA: hypothetical protein VFB96_06175 [Pirellulaceae bacterium]|nr:hypothetical protein [Pirellulaceae bacterium]
MFVSQPTSDSTILTRLEALGPYEFHRASFFWRWTGMPSEIEWTAPAGFKNDLAPIQVALWFTSGKAAADGDLRGLLELVDKFRAGLAEHLADLKHYLVDCFRECYEDQLEEFDRRRLADSRGTIEDAKILRDVQSIHLRWDATGKAIVRTAWIAVGWDEEHGIDVEWDEAGQITRPWRNLNSPP